MNLARSTAMRTFVGVFVAFVLASMATMLASGECPVSTTCGPGVPLSGYEIGCDCMGPGSCAVLVEGSAVNCACTYFRTIVCDCVMGCYESGPINEG